MKRPFHSFLLKNGAWIPIVYVLVVTALISSCQPVPIQPRDLPVGTLVAHIKSLTALAPKTFTPSSTSQITTPTKVNTPTKIRTSTQATPNQSATITAKPTKTRLPTKTKAPTKTPRPTRTSTNTPIPPTPDSPDAQLKILSPGIFSKVTSPFLVSASAATGYGGKLKMELFSEAGELLFQRDWIFGFYNSSRVNVEEEVSFQIAGVSQSAILRFSTVDQYGRRQALAAIPLILINYGEPDIRDGDHLKEPFVLVRPQPEDRIDRSPLKIEGYLYTQYSATILIELEDEKGAIIAAQIVPRAYQPDSHYQPLFIEIPYEIDSPTWVRLIMHMMEPKWGDLDVTSQLIRLIP
jgi:hypothetical protein